VAKSKRVANGFESTSEQDQKKRINLLFQSAVRSVAKGFWFLEDA
jgi:hypothetical protein